MGRIFFFIGWFNQIIANFITCKYIYYLITNNGQHTLTGYDIA